MAVRFTDLVRPPSMTRTEIPSSSEERRTVSAAAFVRLLEGVEAASAMDAAREAAVRSARNEAAAIQDFVLVPAIISEREANMAHTPFVATGWSQQDEKRESQGDEQS